MMPEWISVLLPVLCTSVIVIPSVLGIGCFKCHSFNGSDPSCTDPFHAAWGNYDPDCQQGIKGRVGVFPAFYCIKMRGISKVTGLEIVVRTCSIESMNHQCGLFQFENEKHEGCLTSCPLDGCNTSSALIHKHYAIIQLCLIYLISKILI